MKQTSRGLGVFIFSALFAATGQAAPCSLTHVFDSETKRRAFSLEIPEGSVVIDSCQSFEEPNVEVCWHQDGSLKNLVVLQFDGQGRLSQRTISKYDPRLASPLPLQVDIENVTNKEMLVVHCR